MKTTPSAVTLITAACFLPGGVAAANLLTVNPGFEAAGTQFNQGTQNQPTSTYPGWTYTLFTGGSFTGVGNDQPASEGDQFAYVYNNMILFTESGSRGPAVAGTEYDLLFDGRNDGGNDEGFSARLAFFDAAGNDLGDGGSDAVYAAGVVGNAGDPFALGLGNSGVAPVGTTSLGVSFFVGNNGGAVIDNVSVTAVPEPATLGVAALLGGGLLLRRRRVG